MDRTNQIARTPAMPQGFLLLLVAVVAVVAGVTVVAVVAVVGDGGDPASFPYQKL